MPEVHLYPCHKDALKYDLYSRACVCMYIIIYYIYSIYVTLSHLNQREKPVHKCHIALALEC